MAPPSDSMWTVMVDVFGEERDALAVRDVLDAALATYPYDDPRLQPGDARVVTFDPAAWLALVLDGPTVVALRNAATCLLQLGPNTSAQGILAACEEWLAQSRCPSCGNPFSSCGCE